MWNALDIATIELDKLLLPVSVSYWGMLCLSDYHLDFLFNY